MTQRVPSIAAAAAAFTLAAAAAATAQTVEPRSGYTGFIAMGVSAPTTGDLDNRLRAHGYPDFGGAPIAANVGAYHRLRSGWMLGGEWHFMPGGGGDPGNGPVDLGAGYATLGIAYARELSTRVRVYPRLGLGIGGMGLGNEEQTVEPNDPEFDEWLADPNSGPERSIFSQGSGVVDLGGGAELALRRTGPGPLVGMRAGYIATPFDQGWTWNGRSVRGAPRSTVGGPYLRLMLGWRWER